MVAVETGIEFLGLLLSRLTMHLDSEIAVNDEIHDGIVRIVLQFRFRGVCASVPATVLLLP